MKVGDSKIYVPNILDVIIPTTFPAPITFVLPYVPHQKFMDYYRKMDNYQVQQYMKALFTALHTLHKEQVNTNKNHWCENYHHILVNHSDV